MKKILKLFRKFENKTINLIGSSLGSALTDIWEGTLKKENFKSQVFFWLTISFIYLIDTVVLQGFGFCIDDNEFIKQYYRQNVSNPEQGIKFTLFTIVMGVVCSYINLLLFIWMKHYDEPLESERLLGYNFSHSRRFIYYLILFFILGYSGSFVMSIIAHYYINLNSGILFNFGNLNNINFATPLRQMPECLIIMWSFLGYDFYSKNIKRQLEWRDKMKTMEIENINQEHEMEKDKLRLIDEELSIDKLKEENRKMQEEVKHKSIRLQMVQSRMKPHSLVNILSTIFMKKEKADKESLMLIEQLSNLLRYVLEVSDEKIEKIELSQDIFHILDFIDLKRLYNDDLDVIHNISERVRKEKILKIEKGIIDEFIINAFKYGLIDKEVGEKPFVKIDIDIDDNDVLHLKVENSTVINDELPENTHSSGMGLEYVKYRLDELYPNGDHDITSNFYKDVGRYEIKLKIKLNNEG